MIFSDRELKFLDFVKEQHGDQVRKYTGEPYWHHVVGVAELVAGNPEYTVLIPIAFGHDLLEDTKCTKAMIVQVLIYLEYTSEEIVTIVDGIDALTDKYISADYPHMNRKERKRMESYRLDKIHPRYKTVKIADLINNTASIVTHDPGFARVYLSEKYECLKRLSNATDFELYIVACSTYYDSFLKLNTKLTHDFQNTKDSNAGGISEPS